MSNSSQYIFTNEEGNHYSSCSLHSIKYANVVTRDDRLGISIMFEDGENKIILVGSQAEINSFFNALTFYNQV